MASSQEGPFPPRPTTQHGGSKLTLIPPDSTGPRPTVRKPKSSKSKPRTRRGDEPRFNTGPKVRSVRTQRETSSRSNLNVIYDHDIIYPDYPPPSFLEATTPIAVEHPMQFPDVPLPMPVPPTPTPPVQQCLPSDTDSETLSIEIIESLDATATQWEEDRSQGLPLEVRVKREFHRMCAAASTPDLAPRPFITPLIAESSNSTPRGVLDDRHSFEPSSTSPKWRHLSPLRSLATFKPFGGMSSPPNSPPMNNSPYGLSSASMLPSSTTLGKTFSAPSVKGTLKGSSASLHTSEKRGFFSSHSHSSKGKEREHPESVDLLNSGETIDSWEVVNADASTSVEVAEASAKVKRPGQIAIGLPPRPEKPRPPPPVVTSTAPTISTASIYSTDTKVQPTTHTQTRRPAPPPPKRRAPSKSTPSINTSSIPPSSGQTSPSSPISTIVSKKRPPPPPTSRRSGESSSVSKAPSCTESPVNSPPLWGVNLAFEAALRELRQSTPPAPVQSSPPSNLSRSTPMVTSPLSGHSLTMIDVVNVPPSPGHYHGRPLPRPPGSPRSPVSPIYVPSPFVGTVAQEQESMTVVETSPLPPTDEPRRTDASPAPVVLSQYTDLDVLVSRLEDEAGTAAEADYDTLLLLSEFAGPAVGSPTPNVRTSTSTPLIGKIEIQRRRVTKDGRVKLKLSLLGAVVDNCGICMCQFKSEEKAALGESCKHAFHERCLRSWLSRNPTCPMCRVSLHLER